MARLLFSLESLNKLNFLKVIVVIKKYKTLTKLE